MKQEPRLGALVIGQSPRPDLVGPLAALRPEATIVTVGALDGLTLEELPNPAGAAYPLTTRLRDGSLVTVPESFLIPRLQAQLDRLEASGITTSILLCAGTFAALRSHYTLIKPFQITLAIAKSLGLAKLGFIVPIPAQEAPVAARWRAEGFGTIVWTADLAAQDAAFRARCQQMVAANGLEALVLDYVGYPDAAVAQLRQTVPIPVLDLGAIAIRTAVALT